MSAESPAAPAPPPPPAPPAAPPPPPTAAKPPPVQLSKKKPRDPNAPRDENEHECPACGHLLYGTDAICNPCKFKAIQKSGRAQQLAGNGICGICKQKFSGWGANCSACRNAAAKHHKQVFQLTDEQRAQLQATYGERILTPDEVSALVEGAPEIGRGSAGVIYRATYHDATVAVKRLVGKHVGASDLVEFTTEARLLGRFQHANILSSLAVCLDEPASLLLEIAPLGSVSDALYGTWVTPTWGELLQCAIDATLGLDFLHAQGLLHRDIKSPNVFLWPGWHAKLGDFGLAGALGENEGMEDGPESRRRQFGSPLWMAPEVINHQQYTSACDIYSFGIVLSELVSWRLPYEEVPDLDVDEIMKRVMMSNLRPTLPTWIPAGMRALIESCWHHDVDARPSSATVTASLRALAAEPAAPTLPARPERPAAPVEEASPPVVATTIDAPKVHKRRVGTAERRLRLFERVMEILKMQATLQDGGMIDESFRMEMHWNEFMHLNGPELTALIQKHDPEGVSPTGKLSRFWVTIVFSEVAEQAMERWFAVEPDHGTVMSVTENRGGTLVKHDVSISHQRLRVEDKQTYKVFLNTLNALDWKDRVSVFLAANIPPALAVTDAAQELPAQPPVRLHPFSLGGQGRRRWRLH